MKTQKGFTLIELAVVIAIIAILAAVALPRFGDTTAQAEASLIKDLKAQLASAAAIYTAEQAATPNNFGNFVDGGKTAAKPKTIAVGAFGGGMGCGTPTGTSMTCSGFKKWGAAVYTFTDGVITVKASPANRSPGDNSPAIDF